MASVVFPVPTSPANHRPRPASSWSSSAARYRRTVRSTTGLVRSIDGIGSRSNETPRKRVGIRPATAAALRRASRAGRHEHGYARRAASSYRKPEPSQRPSGQSAGIPVLPRERQEPRVLLLERELDRPQPAVAVLGDDQVGDAL